MNEFFMGLFVFFIDKRDNIDQIKSILLMMHNISPHAISHVLPVN